MKIEELQKKTNKLKTYIEFKTANVMCDKCKEQAVKDTAKEILSDLKEYYFEAMDNTDCAARFDFWCRLCGLEVE